MESLSPNARLILEIQALSERDIALANEEIQNQQVPTTDDEDFLTKDGFEVVKNKRKRKLNVRSEDRIIPTQGKNGKKGDSSQPIKNFQNEKKRKHAAPDN